jgi:hypothetical protein
MMASRLTTCEQRVAWAKVIVLACMLLPVSALADMRISAKVRCQEEYGSASDLDGACERGVDLAERPAADPAGPIAGCMPDGGDAGDEKAVARAAACRRGIALHAGVSTPVSSREKSSFAHSWEQGHGALQVEIGNYDVLLGDAQKSIADCHASFEGSSTPPSCLSGLRIQPKPPDAPPARTIVP